MRTPRVDAAQSANNTPVVDETAPKRRRRSERKPPTEQASATSGAEWQQFAAAPGRADAVTGTQRVLGGQLVAGVKDSDAVPDRLFIGGRFVAPLQGGSLPVYNPATEEVIFRCPAATKEDVDLAVDAARKAFDSKIWSGKSGAERAVFLDAIAAQINQHKDELAALEVRNNGKPLADALVDVSDAATCFAYYAGLARELDQKQGQSLVLPDPNFRSKVVKEPLGVAAAVIPWNYPLLMAAWKVAPALAAGCTMVLKPSEVTPLTALKLAQIADQVGLPAGVLNVVPGTGAAAGSALTKNPGVDKLAFTGGTETGKRIMQAASENIKPVTLELGGKSAAIVFDDADLNRNVDWILYGIFGAQGEVCSATSRVLVHEKVAAELVKRLVERARALPIGEGMGEGVKVGPLVSKEHYEKVLGYIAAGKQEGATLVCGGGRPAGASRGYFVEPTIFTNVGENMRIWKEEIFGPVLCIKTFRDEAEAVRLANNSDYGLAAAVMSRDAQRCERVARQLQAGIVWINSSQPTFVQAPWGGFKKSGIGRELGPWGLDNYLQVKQITEYVGQAPWTW